MLKSSTMKIMLTPIKETDKDGGKKRNVSYLWTGKSHCVENIHIIH